MVSLRFLKIMIQQEIIARDKELGKTENHKGKKRGFHVLVK